MLVLPKETETSKSSGNDDAPTTEVSTDNLLETLDQQPTTADTDEPKLDQELLDTIAAAVTASETSVTSSGGPSFGGNGSSSQCLQNANDPPEMPQLMSILNELLDGQDLASLANTGGNGDNMADMVDQDPEENYDDDSPRKDDPEELIRVQVQQKLEESSKEQQQLQRKMDFLIRRLYKLVARSTGLHASEEIAGFLEHVARHNTSKKESTASKFPCLTANLQGSTVTIASEPPIDLLSSPSTSQELRQTNDDAANLTATDVIEPEALKPVPMVEMKSFLRRIENLSKMQSTILSKRTNAMKYFSKPAPNNFNNMTSKSEAASSSNTIPQFSSNDVEQLEQVSGLLVSEMRLIEKQIDSDATASSSGGESADEMVAYNNAYQQPLTISKRAAYKYAKDRGAVASRWSWLATQISELDYKIRQNSDLRKHIKDSKGAVTLEEVAGFEGQLPGSHSNSYGVDDDERDDGSSARCRAFVKASFRKRKLVSTTNLHQTSKKAGRPSSLKCGCQWPLPPCALCTGRVDPTAPRDLPDTLPTAERVALLDPGFHPVLSFPDDVSHNIHLEAIMNIPEWQTKMIRTSPKAIMKYANKELELLLNGGGNGGFKSDMKFGPPKGMFGGDGSKTRKDNIDMLTGKRKYTKKQLKLEGILANKLKDRKKHRKRPGLLLNSANSHVPRKYTFKKRLQKIKDGISYSNQNYSNFPNGLNGSTSSDKHFDPLNRSKNSSPVPNHHQRSEKKTSESRSNRNYDIDNIVIPYSVAASTRVEVLSYKEIPTPKWRLVSEVDELEQLVVEEKQCNQTGESPDDEDISDEVLVVNHQKAQMEERKKFETYLKFPLTSRSRANRRIDSRGNESSGANTPTPDPTSPAPALSADLESIPSPLDHSELQETMSMTALLNNFTNGRKDRNRTTSRKDDSSCHDGSVSGSASRCISPETIKETIPAYEPLNFPLTVDSLHKLKREMPPDHLRHVERYYTTPRPGEGHHSTSQQQNSIAKRSVHRPPHPKKPRKHNDSISESKLIKEKLPSSSLATIGKSINVLIPRNNHNILENIDLTTTDGAVLKKLMNNNNGDLNLNGDDFGDDTEDLNDDSDSETVTGDESMYEQEDDQSESDDFMIGQKTQTFKKRNSLVTNARMLNP